MTNTEVHNVMDEIKAEHHLTAATVVLNFDVPWKKRLALNGALEAEAVSNARRYNVLTIAIRKTVAAALSPASAPVIRRPAPE
jgi:hypothetical protein